MTDNAADISRTLQKTVHIAAVRPSVLMSTSATYRAVLGSPGVFPVLAGTLLSRIAASMWNVVAVVFALNQFHSPTLAGISLFCATAPALLLGPVSGAVLDRWPRAWLVALDFGSTGTLMIALALLALARTLTPAEMLTAFALAGATTPLGRAGARSLLPRIVAPGAWDRLNSLDSSGFAASTLIGPALGGLLVGLNGGIVGLGVIGAVNMVAAILVVGSGLDVTGTQERRTSLLSETLDGLVYVCRNSALRWMTAISFVLNFALGTLLVGVPVTVIDRLGEASGVVGILWAVAGLAGIAFTLLVGRAGTRGREHRLLAGGTVAYGVVTMTLGFASALVVLLGAMAVLGAGEACADLGYMAIRQRHSDPNRWGRVVIVTMTANMTGVALGGATAGVLIGGAPRVAPLVLGALVTIAAVIAMVPAVRGHTINYAGLP